MHSGLISFNTLFEYIRRHKEIPHKTEAAFVGYKDHYLNLCRTIPEIPGWYAWVQSVNCPPKIIYIGQSQTRKTASLRSRIREEFLDEYVALWATIWDRDEVVNTLDRKENQKYTKEIKRAARKAGSTHIIWLGEHGISDKDLTTVEHQLIAKNNPPANRRNITYENTCPELLTRTESELQKKIERLELRTTIA